MNPATTEKLEASAPALRSISLPPIGAAWHGGLYAGIARGADGAPDYHLILGPEAPKALTWDAACQWAVALDFAGHRDFTLPARREQSLLFAHLREEFQETWYWSDEPYAGDEAYAWVQVFGFGTQYGYRRKSDHYRARAVRRVPL